MKINVLGHDYKIVYTNKMDQNITGLCKYPSREIFVLKSLDKKTKLLTLLHELRHAYQFESGLTQVLQSQALEQDCEMFASFVESLKLQKVI